MIENRRNKGITLIALIITIIVLMLIAGISISFLIGENGILNKAKTASEETNIQAAIEKLKLALTEIKLNKNIQNMKLVNLNDLQDSSSENYSADIKLEKEVIEGDIISNLIVDGNYKFSVDTNFNITYLGKVEDVQLDDRLIAYTTFDEQNTKGSLKEEIRDTPYTNIVESGVYSTNKNKKIGAGSAYFEGVGSQRLIKDISELNLGVNDFTIELWIYPETQVVSYPLICGDDDNLDLRFFLSDVSTAGNIVLVLGSSQTRIINTGKKYITNAWTHYAIVRKNGVFTIYENGINIGQTSSYLTSNVNISKLCIGGDNSTTNTAYKGYMDDFAIYNYAKYTINFVPIESPNSDANLVYSSFNDYKKEIIDTFSNMEYNSVIPDSIIVTDEKYKFGKSAYFKGLAAQRLKRDIPELNLGVNDFTIELWIYPETQVVSFPLICGDDDNIDLRFFLSDGNSDGNIVLVLGSSQTRIINTGKKYAPNVWTHYAITRKNGVFTLYENGINIGQTSSYLTSNVNISKLCMGGDNSTTNTAYKGYMDDFTIYNYARYNENFTVNNNPLGIK